jgi:DNA-binding NtrC family response regulator
MATNGTSEGRVRVLVIEDDATSRLLLGELLSMTFEVELVEDVRNAERLLAARPFDAVVSDYSLPGESGLSFLRRLQRREGAPLTVLLTGHSELEDVHHAMEEGAPHVFMKPVDPDELVRLLAAARG